MELSVVVPTFNERDNIELLYNSIDKVLVGREWEVVFVDDNSPDGTSDKIRELASKKNNVRLLERIGRRGLSSACIEGMMSCASEYLVVMDADLQHDENLLLPMIQSIQNKQCNLAVGSRFISGGTANDGLTVIRKKGSELANKLAKVILGNNSITDPMSGFFVIEASIFQKLVRNLSGRGFKILFDICSHGGDTIRLKEFAYNMKARNRGESKMDLKVVTDFLVMLVEKRTVRALPIRFILFVLVVPLVCYFILRFYGFPFLF